MAGPTGKRPPAPGEGQVTLDLFAPAPSPRERVSSGEPLARLERGAPAADAHAALQHDAAGRASASQEGQAARLPPARQSAGAASRPGWDQEPPDGLFEVPFDVIFDETTPPWELDGAVPSRAAAPPGDAALRARSAARHASASPPSAAPATRRGPDAASQQAATGPRVYRVSEIVRLAGRALEARFAEVWIEGEVSNCKQPGHLYFTLKDADAQLTAVMWRSDVARLRFRVQDGLKVRARGRLTIYPEKGSFQMAVEHLEPAGLGALQLAFEQLKRKLAAEGLFATERKRPLPYLPRRIGVATSLTGAAVRDIVRVAQRRGPVRILVAPCQVQGDAAPLEIVRALRALERQRDVEVIIVGRGGGSMEDLWAFNDEGVARAIAACRVPVISAVGHEVDYTIADFVADARAATPSQAAELAVPVHAELAERLGQLRARLLRAGRAQVGQARQRLDAVVERCADLLHRSMSERRLALAALQRRLTSLHPRARLAVDRAGLERAQARLRRPVVEAMTQRRRALAELAGRLDAAMQQALARRQRIFAGSAAKLEAMSPLKVLDRGYALVRSAGGHVVTRAAQVVPGEEVMVQLAEGRVRAAVVQVDPGPAGDDG